MKTPQAGILFAVLMLSLNLQTLHAGIADCIKDCDASDCTTLDDYGCVSLKYKCKFDRCYNYNQPITTTTTTQSTNKKSLDTGMIILIVSVIVACAICIGGGVFFYITARRRNALRGNRRGFVGGQNQNPDIDMPGGFSGFNPNPGNPNQPAAPAAPTTFSGASVGPSSNQGLPGKGNPLKITPSK
jgi:hypothetical protein